MRKPDKRELIQKVCKLASLPEGKAKFKYFNRQQLTELVLYLETLNNIVDQIKQQEGQRNEGESCSE